EIRWQVGRSLACSGRAPRAAGRASRCAVRLIRGGSGAGELLRRRRRIAIIVLHVKDCFSATLYHLDRAAIGGERAIRVGRLAAEWQPATGYRFAECCYRAEVVG